DGDVVFVALEGIAVSHFEVHVMIGDCGIILGIMAAESRENGIPVAAHDLLHAVIHIGAAHIDGDHVGPAESEIHIVDVETDVRSIHGETQYSVIARRNKDARNNN